MQIREIKISLQQKDGYLYFRTGSDPVEVEVKIEFGTAKNLRDFLHSGEKLCSVDKNLVKIIKINKMRHTSVEATIQKITLREYNLERLLL